MGSKSKVLSELIMQFSVLNLRDVLVSRSTERIAVCFAQISIFQNNAIAFSRLVRVLE